VIPSTSNYIEYCSYQTVENIKYYASFMAIFSLFPDLDIKNGMMFPK
jgi:hypothetical protein